MVKVLNDRNEKVLKAASPKTKSDVSKGPDVNVLSRTGVRLYDKYPIGMYGKVVKVDGRITEYHADAYKFKLDSYKDGVYLISVYCKDMYVTKWSDTKLDANRWVRYFIDDGYKVYYQDNVYEYMEISYNTGV